MSRKLRNGNNIRGAASWKQLQCVSWAGSRGTVTLRCEEETGYTCPGAELAALRVAAEFWGKTSSLWKCTFTTEIAVWDAFEGCRVLPNGILGNDMYTFQCWTSTHSHSMILFNNLLCNDSVLGPSLIIVEESLLPGEGSGFSFRLELRSMHKKC